MQNALVDDENLVDSQASSPAAVPGPGNAEAPPVGLAEELRRQGESVEKLIRSMEKHHDELRDEMKAQFALAEKRHDELRGEVNGQFALAEKRIDELRAETNRRFEDLMRSMDKRFNQNFRFVTVGVAVLGLLATAYKFWVV